MAEADEPRDHWREDGKAKMFGDKIGPEREEALIKVASRFQRRIDRRPLHRGGNHGLRGQKR